MVAPGDAFWIKNPAISAQHHLFFAITSPLGSEGSVILVNVTTKREGADLSCVLEPGDHPRITRESVIHYAGAFEVKMENIEKAVRTLPDFWIPVEKATPTLLRAIQEGALSSERFPQKYKERAKSELDCSGP